LLGIAVSFRLDELSRLRPLILRRQDLCRQYRPFHQGIVVDGYLADCLFHFELAELQYNLAEAYQDDNRHGDALEILRKLCKDDSDEQRYAVHRFISCQALRKLDEMREIVEDLDVRRRALYEQAMAKLAEYREMVRKRLEERKEEEKGREGEGENGRQGDKGTGRQGDKETALAVDGETAEEHEEEQTERRILSVEERKELVTWRRLVRFDPPVVDYLKAQVRAMENRPEEALELLQRVTEAHLARPGLFLQTADLYLKLRRFDQAEQTYAKALAIDPDNPHAHVGMARLALRRRQYVTAVQSALDALQRLYHYPLAHFLLGVALLRLKELPRAAEAFRAALSLNPNFAQAHVRLAWILRQLGDKAGAADHRRRLRELKEARFSREPLASAKALQHTGRQEGWERGIVKGPSALEKEMEHPVCESVIVVSGLPRSGTSMIMQMLTAGGVPVLSDGQRVADDDNPLGYYEFEPVKHLHESADWVKGAKGKVVKVVAPLLHHLPRDLDYRIVFIERDVDEVLASQGQMLTRRGQNIDDSPARRNRLKETYCRQLQNLRTTLSQRARTQTLFLCHADAIANPRAAAELLNDFLGGGLDAGAMAEEVKPDLHRQRAAPAEVCS